MKKNAFYACLKERFSTKKFFHSKKKIFMLTLKCSCTSLRKSNFLTKGKISYTCLKKRTNSLQLPESLLSKQRIFYACRTKLISYPYEYSSSILCLYRCCFIWNEVNLHVGGSLQEQLSIALAMKKSKHDWFFLLFKY